VILRFLLLVDLITKLYKLSFHYLRTENTPPLLLTVAMQLVVTNDPHPHEYVTFSDFAYPAYALCISCFQSFKIIWIPSRLVLSVPDEGYSRNASSALMRA
jgi:hypothetical protein